MAILNNSNAISSGGYDINNSLRFRASATASLTRTFGTSTDVKKLTYSGWVKRGTLSSDAALFAQNVTSAGYNECRILFNTSNQLSISTQNGSGNVMTIITTQVFRDPSAWYHIVIAVDTTQATAANRVLVYVNGSQVTTFGTATYPSQNVDPFLNTSSIAHANGAAYHSGSTSVPNIAFLDGYMAEVNFIDGQALTPSSFGETDTTTGSWKPKAYTGTYGTNGFYLPFTINNSTSSYAGSFNGSSQYLSSSTALFNYTTANAATQTATIEAMVYLNSYQTPSQVYYSPAIAGKGDVYMNLGVNGSGNLIFYHYDGTARTITGSSVIPLNTWTYVALTISGGTATIYVNGTSVGSGTWYGIQAAGQSSTSYFGRPATSGSALYLNGYISNLRVSSIARTISTPATSYSNDANTNFLTLQSATVVDNSTNAYAITNTGTVTTSVSYPFYTTSVSADYSGNNNNWTANNINAAVLTTTYDAMIDSPTLTSATVANYCVLNPINLSTSSSTSNANLRFTNSNGGTSWRSVGSTIAPTSGKWYWEGVFSGSTGGTGIYAMVGVFNPNNYFITNYAASTFWDSGYSYYGDDGYKRILGAVSAYGSSFTNGDIIGLALDLDSGTLTCYKNNVSQGVLASGLSGPLTPAFANYDNNATVTANFGQRPFTYTPPTGFVALNTYNLPDSTIKKGNTVMDATTYTGTSAVQSVTNASLFKPDFVWIKCRSTINNNSLFDAVRGATSQLFSNLTNAEAVGSDGFTSFNSNGFSLDNSGSGGNVNVSARTYVGWQWQAGQGTTSSNTSGSITSTVSVSTTAGFSVVTYTGTGANATVGHGLGVAPKMVIVKGRSGAGAQNWMVYTAALGNTYYGYLNLTNAFENASSTIWNNISPTSTTFSIGTNSNVNTSTSPYVAYCWAEIAGFSKFGSYAGNSSTDGPFIYLGFRPKFILVKKYAGGTPSDWHLHDTTRDTYNSSNTILIPDSSGAEAVNAAFAFDILSNGFKLRNSDGSTNGSGLSYIYMAFAENPFKNANAR